MPQIVLLSAESIKGLVNHITTDFNNVLLDEISKIMNMPFDENYHTNDENHNDILIALNEVLENIYSKLSSLNENKDSPIKFYYLMSKKNFLPNLFYYLFTIECYAGYLNAILNNSKSMTFESYREWVVLMFNEC